MWCQKLLIIGYFWIVLIYWQISLARAMARLQVSMSLSSPTTFNDTTNVETVRVTKSNAPIASMVAATTPSSLRGSAVPSLRTHVSHQETTAGLRSSASTPSANHTVSQSLETQLSSSGSSHISVMYDVFVNLPHASSICCFSSSSEVS